MCLEIHENPLRQLLLHHVTGSLQDRFPAGRDDRRKSRRNAIAGERVRDAGSRMERREGNFIF